MDDKNQKERLEQELRFLKESFEAEVISKEEFEKGKDRIEKKLREIKSIERKQGEAQETQSVSGPQKSEGFFMETIKEQIEEEKPEEPKEKEHVQKEPEKIKLKVIQDETEPPQYFESTQETEQKAAPEEPAFEEPEKESKFLKYAVVFVVLLLIVFFSYSLLKSEKNIQETSQPLKFAPACSSNDDCRQAGKEGKCLESGTTNAKCEFKEIQKTNVLVLNDRQNCFNCGTQRILSILENWFGAINVKEVDYNTDEGKNVAEKFDAKILPVYILGENITKNSGFKQFKAAFAKKDNNYVLSEDAAGSTFYLRRDNMPNKLDFFVISGDDASIKAEKNLKEFLEAFRDVKFEKHLSTDKLSQELAIKTYPTFLINNVDKFNGVHSAETIRENFCKLNKLPACEKSLSKSLV